MTSRPGRGLARCVVPADKAMRQFKIALSSRCVLRCDYCFIDKDFREDMPLEMAMRGVDFFVQSPGQRKLLQIYGGEPLLRFDDVKRLSVYAEKAAEACGKQLVLDLSTNGVMLASEHLDFIRDHGVQLSMSFGGDREAHDRFRTFANGQGSYDRMLSNLPLALAKLDPRVLTALLCVHPDQAGRVHDHFEELVSLGFSNVNIEVVHGVRWSPEAVRAFRDELRKVAETIVAWAARKKFVFFESMFSIFESNPSARALCPAYCNGEVFPDGTISFYPYPFLDGMEERRLASVGNIRDGFDAKYRDCSFDPRSAACRSCGADYYRLARITPGNIPYESRNRIAVELGKTLLSLAGRQEDYRAYLREARLRYSSRG